MMIDPSRLLTPKSNAKSSRRIIREKIPRGRKNRHRDIKFPLDLGEVSKMCATMSVIFPAFNEEGNIRRTVEAAVKVLPKIAMSWEIIVVNDGSSDATTAICDDLKARYPQVEVISHGQNRGYGAALKSGIMAAKYDLIFFSDSDGQFDLCELQQLICWAEHYDIVAGYRAKRQDPLHRRINALGWNVLVRLVLGIKIRDIDCAFKLFRRAVFDQIQIRCVGAMVNTEILAQATRFGMRIHQVKVSHFPRRHGKQSGANIHVIIKAFRELCRLWRQLRHVAPDQTGLYSAATKEAYGAPMLPDPRALLRLSRQLRNVAEEQAGLYSKQPKKKEGSDSILA